ncbi:MAG: hypothetical protein QOF76_2543 [Solirubrobacteraceae bacterium]|jgi:protocatechuate 3,4-dioxygenase beta subunit|nr:hypothetical protein [Solirubrobacteraceae bacterium]
MSPTRREALATAGVAGAALVVGGVRPPFELGSHEAYAAATCVATPDKTVGPYFVDEKLDRSDVTGDQAGTPLALTIYVFDADHDCKAIPNAQVDIWHASSKGLYSDESANGTSGQRWLRGYQVSDAGGKVVFKTFWPGSYTGRAVHIHFKIRIAAADSPTGSRLEITSQMFFPEDLNSKISYVSAGRTTNSQDSIYGGSTVLLLDPKAAGDGYTAEFSAGVTQAQSHLDNVSPTGGGGPGPGGPQPLPTVTPTPGIDPQPTDEVVSAKVKKVRVEQTAAGRRQVRLNVVADEEVAAVIKLTRAGKTIASKTVKALAPGKHALRLAIPASTPAGAAMLRVTLKDGVGNKKSKKSAIHVHSRR